MEDKKLIELKAKLDRENIELENDLALKQIEIRRKAEIEVENLKFDHQLQMQRIKSAEIRKNIRGGHF